MVSAIQSALDSADKRGCRSVGIALMGAGLFEWPAQDAANAVVGALSAWLRRGTKRTITRVTLFDMDVGKVQAFVKAVTDTHRCDFAAIEGSGLGGGCLGSDPGKVGGGVAKAAPCPLPSAPSPTMAGLEHSEVHWPFASDSTGLHAAAAVGSGGLSQPSAPFVCGGLDDVSFPGEPVFAPLATSSSEGAGAGQQIAALGPGVARGLPARFEHNVTKLQVVVKVCGALDLDVECLAYGTDTEFRMDGGLAEAIAQAAGRLFVMETRAAKGSHPVVGKAIITGSGSLASAGKIQAIVHVLAPNFKMRGYLQFMMSAVQMALQLANDRGCRSLGIPLIGSGLYEWPAQDAADAIVCALAEWLRKGSCNSVQRVVLFDADATKGRAFLSAMQSSHAHDFLAKA
mmetsp:Transcript_47714/g.126528  ORF Transcript_47714/g.126528 Transcript_47714/m.126528 type:complete len:400 (-) Transcript_47714:89-1288(-)